MLGASRNTEKTLVTRIGPCPPFGVSVDFSFRRLNAAGNKYFGTDNDSILERTSRPWSNVIPDPYGAPFLQFYESTDFVERTSEYPPTMQLTPNTPQQWLGKCRDEIWLWTHETLANASISLDKTAHILVHLCNKSLYIPTVDERLWNGDARARVWGIPSEHKK